MLGRRAFAVRRRTAEPALRAMLACLGEFSRSGRAASAGDDDDPG
jgi:hypothetical protein